jgi:hypothetical protein
MDGCLLLACMVGDGTLFSTHILRSKNIFFGCGMGKEGGRGRGEEFCVYCDGITSCLYNLRIGSYSTFVKFVWVCLNYGAESCISIKLLMRT